MKQTESDQETQLYFIELTNSKFMCEYVTMFILCQNVGRAYSMFANLFFISIRLRETFFFRFSLDIFIAKISYGFSYLYKMKYWKQCVKTRQLNNSCNYLTNKCCHKFPSITYCYKLGVELRNFS